MIHQLRNSKTIVILVLLILISTFLHVYQFGKPGLNEDEAAQGYNTYAVLETGYDEYRMLPTRFLSFGEQKLPLVGLLSAPFITLLGLNLVSVRFPVLLIGVFSPVLFYVATYALTKSKKAAIISAFIASSNVWIHTTSRHQHEAVVLAAIVLVYIATLLRQELSKRNVLNMGLLVCMGLFTYHSAKIIMPFLVLSGLIIIWQRQKNIFLLGLITFSTAFFLFGMSELFSPTNRVNELSYFTSPTFIHEIEEGRRLGGSSLYYNKIIYGTHKGVERILGYFSPSFLHLKSDPNPRFGSDLVPLLTLSEFSLFWVGLILMWIKKYEYRIFLTGLMLVSALPAALALPLYSSTRSFTLVVPIIITISIAGDYLCSIINEHKTLTARFVGVCVMSILLFFHLVGIARSWNNYFTVYLTSAETARAWQGGAMEMARYIWKQYRSFDQFVITRAYGQPYIYLLFSKPYSPELYQRLPKNHSYNQYGFWEQDGFDKFTFIDGVKTDNKRKTAYIITPEEAKANRLDTTTLVPISSNGVTRFYVKENH